MSKRLSDRLAALEALEAEYHTDDSALAAVEHLGDEAVLAEAFSGLRLGSLHYYGGELCPMDKGSAYWRGIAERAWDLCVERQVWICPVTEEESARACQALRSGLWLMRIRSTTLPDVWYDPTPPAPFFNGCWTTPEYHALKRLASALFMWGRFWWHFSDAPPMPATIEEVIVWAEMMGAPS